MTADTIAFVDTAFISAVTFCVGIVIGIIARHYTQKRHGGEQ